MKSENRLQIWLNTAVSGIRFKPDREAVEQELREHLEDKMADLQRFYHVSQEEAEEMALERMGNAEEIGKEMAKIHKPWWGYLWLFSQTVVILLAIMAVLVWYRSDGDDIRRAFIGWEYDQSKTASPWYWVRDDECHYVQVVELDVPVIEVGQYRISAQRAELWEYEGFANVPEGHRVVYLELNVSYGRPWEEPHDLSSHLWAEDDAGTYFFSRDELYTMNQLKLPMRTHVKGYGIGDGPFRSTYQLILGNVSLKAQEVTLHYDRMGTEFALPIVLEGEGETWVKN